MIYTAIYEGCGNRVLIYQLHNPNDLTILKNSHNKQKQLSDIAINANCDSVMVITQNPEHKKAREYDLTMDVFEPHSFLHGNTHTWSTMCGNGIRAVAAFVLKSTDQKPPYRILTGAGIQLVKKINDDWEVDMGYFAQAPKELKHYVTVPTLNQALFGLEEKMLEDSLFYGFHYQQKNKIDGEPHVVVFLKKQIATKQQHNLLTKLGRLFCSKKEIFPQEINVTLAHVNNINPVSVSIATYERNIYYITKACGTAATVTASLIYERLELKPETPIEIRMSGGTLTIIKNRDDRFRMIGNATECYL